MVERRKPLVLSATKTLLNSLLPPSTINHSDGIHPSPKHSLPNLHSPAGILRLSKDHTELSRPNLDDAALVGFSTSSLKRLSITSGSLEFNIMTNVSTELEKEGLSVFRFEFAGNGVLPKYFSSEWSVAQFRLREGCHYIVAFGHQKNTVIILGMDESFYRCQFDPVAGGDMTELECHNFLKQE